MLNKRAAIDRRRYQRLDRNLSARLWSGLNYWTTIIILSRDQSVPQRINCQLNAITQPEFIEYIVEVSLNRRFGDSEALSDLSITKAAGDMAHDLGFAAGQR